MGNIDKRLIIGALLTIGVALSFWLGSRYPDLREKSAIGAERDLQGIAFDVVLEVQEDDPFWKRVSFTMVNWMATNKKGMAFGLVFAACLLTILSFLNQGRFDGLMANTFKGFLIGAPLGLCVNCAAPVAFGLHKGGSRPETALGAMLSSPSMNVIVIGMMFSLLPWHIALLKLLISFVLIFAFVPLLVRLAPSRWITPRQEAVESCPISPVAQIDEQADAPENWRESLLWTARMFFTNLWRVGKQTVPLMLLAGLLGSLLITALPFDVTRNIAEAGSRFPFVPMLFAVATVGVFLPVPMAFDVVVVVILMGLGVPSSITTVLLLTLGSYSIYSYIIVAKAFSHAAALTITAVVVLAGVVGGMAAPQLKRMDVAIHKLMLAHYFKNSKPVERERPAPPPAHPWEEIKAELDKSAIQLQPFTGFTNTTPAAGQITIDAFEFAPRSTNTAGPLFKRFPGEEWGIDVPTHFSIRKLVLYPQVFVRGMAAGDIHGDNYPDLLICADPDLGGLYLFANLGGKRFVRQELDIGELSDKCIFSAAFVDLNNDQWLDIVFTTLDDGNYAILNDHGQFPRSNMTRLSHRPGASCATMGFADFDGNGALDMFLGNYTIGHVGRLHPISHESSRNQILFNMDPKNGRFEIAEMPDLPGETLGILVTDLNRDRLPDFICYNDWSVPDMYYLGETNGSFRRLGPEDKLVPESGYETMSIRAADVDNDLDPEIYITQISGHNQVNGRHSIRIPLSELEKHAASEKERKLIRKFEQHLKVFDNQNDMLMLHFIPEELRQDWMAYKVVRRAAEEMDTSYRAMVPEHRKDVHMFLNRIESPHTLISDDDRPGEIPQNRNNENLLLKRDKDGILRNQARAFGLDHAGWTWNAAFADVDHDEFQDVYIATSFFQFHNRDDNTFFHNLGGKKFELKTREFGLSDYAATSAFDYLDIERDGDLDIISLPVTIATARVFQNQGPKGNSITIELRDQLGNSYGVGAEIVIRYGPDGKKHQLRAISASGGFVSFDPLEAHFGLGPHQSVKTIEVRWRDGRDSLLEGPFPANRCYRIRRSRAAAALQP